MLWSTTFSVHSRLQRALGKNKRRRARRKPYFRKSVTMEELEDRRVLTTIVVDTADDIVSATDSRISLREALALAEDIEGTDTIRFSPALYGATISLDSEQGPLEITSDVVIEGLGAETLTIDGMEQTRIFHVFSGHTLEIRDLSLIRGKVTGTGQAGSGGAILAHGPVTLRDTAIKHNSAYTGGAIWTSKALEIHSSVIANNFSTQAAAAIFLSTNSSLDMTYSSIADNQSQNSTAGIYAARAASISIFGSTFSGNTGGSGSGGLLASRVNEVTIERSTFSLNTGGSAGSGGARIYGDPDIFGGSGLGGFSSSPPHTAILRNNTFTNNEGGQPALGVYDDIHIEVYNTIVAGNTRPSNPSAPDLSGTFDVAEGNLIGIGHTSNGIVHGTDGNQVGSSSQPLEANLGPLTNNGGLTRTHGPRTNSLAINAGINAHSPPGFDQRGEGFDSLLGPVVDVGAVEANATLVVSGSGTAVAGEEYRIDIDLLGALRDTGGDTTITVDWGDGSETQIEEGEDDFLFHQYDDPFQTYEITATAEYDGVNPLSVTGFGHRVTTQGRDSDDDLYTFRQTGGTYPPAMGSPVAGAATFNAEKTAILMTEGDSFLSELSWTVTTGQDPSQLHFQFHTLKFVDVRNKQSISDAFELALLDANGNSVVPVVGNQRDAFFNVTADFAPLMAEGTTATFGQFAQQIAAGHTDTLARGIVSLDVSHLPPNMDLTAVARLINNDSVDDIAGVTIVTKSAQHVTWGIGDVDEVPGQLFQYIGLGGVETPVFESFGQLRFGGTPIPHNEIFDFSIDAHQFGYAVSMEPVVAMGTAPVLLVIDLTRVEFETPSQYIDVGVALELDFPLGALPMGSSITGLAAHPSGEYLFALVNFGDEITPNTLYRVDLIRDASGQLSSTATAELVGSIVNDVDEVFIGSSMTMAIDGNLWVSENAGASGDGQRVVLVNSSTALIMDTYPGGFTKLMQGVFIDPISHSIYAADQSEAIYTADGDEIHYFGANDLSNVRGLSFPIPRRGPVVLTDRGQDPSSVDFSALVDISSVFDVAFDHTTWNESAQQLDARYTIYDKGQYDVKGTLLVGVRNLNPPSVQLVNVDGYSPQGMPYYNVSRLVYDVDEPPPPMCDPTEGDVTDPPGVGDLQLSFQNPTGAQFTYDLVVLGNRNRPPEFTNTPTFTDEIERVIEVPAGSIFRYAPMAEDSDGDDYFYTLVTGTAGNFPLKFNSVVPDCTNGGRDISLDGSIWWQPTVADIGNSYPIVMQVEDTFGAFTQQQFTIRVTAGVPNRAPYFIEPFPGSAAVVGQPYQFQLHAYDPDGDSLTFELAAESPLSDEEFVVSSSGMITWTPRDDQVHSVFTLPLLVHDRADPLNGFRRTGRFDLTVRVFAANQDPFFTSIVPTGPEDPFGSLIVPPKVTGTSANVTPNAINTALGSNQVAEFSATGDFPSILVHDVNVLTKADIIFVVDRGLEKQMPPLPQSGIMAQFHSIFGRGADMEDCEDSALCELDERLAAAGIDVRYGLTAFPGLIDTDISSSEVYDFADTIALQSTGNLWGSYSELATKISQLTEDAQNQHDNNIHDGYMAILKALSVIEQNYDDPATTVEDVIRNALDNDAIEQDSRYDFRTDAAKIVIFVSSRYHAPEPAMNGSTVIYQGATQCDPKAPFCIDITDVDSHIKYLGGILHTVVPFPIEVEHDEPASDANDGTSLFEFLDGHWSIEDVPLDAYPNGTEMLVGEMAADPTMPLATAIFRPSHRFENATFPPGAEAVFVNAVTVGWQDPSDNSDAFFLFDYHSSTDFKFVRMRPTVGTSENEWEVSLGHYEVCGNCGDPFVIYPPILVGTSTSDLNELRLQVLINPYDDQSGTTVAVYAKTHGDPDGDFIEHTFPDPLLDGRAGLGTTSVARFDEFISGWHPDDPSHYPPLANPALRTGESDPEAALPGFAIWDDFNGRHAIGALVSPPPKSMQLPIAVPGYIARFDDATPAEPAFEKFFAPTRIENYLDSIYVEAELSGSASFEVVYDVIGGDFSGLAFANLGMSWDLELIITDSNSAPYAKSFAHALADHVSNSMTVTIVPDDPPQGTFVENDLFPLCTASTQEGDAECMIQFVGDGYAHRYDLLVLTGPNHQYATIPVSIRGVYEFPLSAIDPDGDDPLEFRWGTTWPDDGLPYLPPEGAHLIPLPDGGSGRHRAILRYSPPDDLFTQGGNVECPLMEDDVACVGFAVEVSDLMGGRDFQHWTLFVNLAENELDPPEIDDIELVAEVLRPISYTIQATSPTGSPLQYFVSKKDEAGSDDIPPDLRVDRYTGQLTWTPSAIDYSQATNGTYELAVRARDATGAWGTADLTITVVNSTTVNLPPTFVFDEPPPFIRPLDADGVFRMTLRATDPNGDVLRFIVAGMPGIVVDTIGNTAEVRWRPDDDLFPLNYAFRAMVTDGRASDMYRFQVAVGVFNTPPVFTTLSPLPNLYEERPFELFIRALDPFEPGAASPNAVYPVQFTTLTGIDGPLPWLQFEQLDGFSARLFGTPPEITCDPQCPPKETVTFHFTAKDNSDQTTTKTFTLDVLPDPGVNGLPRLTSFPRDTVAVNQEFVYRIKYEDDENDPVTVSLIESEIEPLYFDAPTSTIRWVPQSSDINGNPYSYTIELCDAWQGPNCGNEFEFSLSVTSQHVNSAPAINSVAVPSAVVDREYRIPFTAVDADGDPVRWSLKDATSNGMLIDFETGHFIWTPRPRDIGAAFVTVVATDPYGARSEQRIAIEVIAVNRAPILRGFAPPAIVALNQDIPYRLDVFDPDQGPEPTTVTVTMDDGSQAPSWLSVTHDNILIIHPTGGEPPSETHFALHVTDGLLTSTYAFEIQVVTGPVNLPPVFQNIPPLYIVHGDHESWFTSVAVDPDPADPNNPIIAYAVFVPVLTGDNAPSINSATGVIDWDTRQICSQAPCTYRLTITATDGDDRTSLQTTTVILVNPQNSNNAPVIAPIEDHYIGTGANYGLTVLAHDPDGDAVFFALNSNAPNGMTINPFTGRIQWVVPDEPEEFYDITVFVSDSFGAQVDETFRILTTDADSPSVLVTPSASNVFPNRLVTFSVFATSLSGIASVTLTTTFGSNDPVSLPLNSTLVASHHFIQIGVHEVTAMVVSGSGEMNSHTIYVTVHDPTMIIPDLAVYEENSSGVPTVITETITVVYSIGMPLNIHWPMTYELWLIPQSTGAAISLASGTTSGSTSGTADINPDLYPDGEYRLELLAHQFVLLQSYTTRIYYDVVLDSSGTGCGCQDPDDTTYDNNDLRTGNLALTFTDLHIPLGGIPINVQRTYDTIETNKKSDFGHGWKLEYRHARISTLGTAHVDDQFDGAPSFFTEHTVVRITLPGGDRESFLFIAQPIGGPLPRYVPTFIPRPGTASRLEVITNPYVHPNDLPNAGSLELIYSTHITNPRILVGSTDPLIPYHPINFQQFYRLTTRDGMQYTMDATTGLIDSIKDREGNQLKFTDTQITALDRTGTVTATVLIHRQNELVTRITDPDGKVIRYDYDAAFTRLTRVTNREDETVQFEYNVDADDNPVMTQRPHTLTRITDHRGVRVLQAEFDDATGRLSGLTDALERSAAFDYAFEKTTTLGTFLSETITDANQITTETLRDDRGNVVRRMQQIAVDEYLVTVYAYDENDFLVGTSKSYLAQELNQYDLGLDEPARPDLTSSSPDFSDWVSWSVFSPIGDLLEHYDAEGSSNFYSNYDIYGSPLVHLDPSGTSTTNVTDNVGRLLDTVVVGPPVGNTPVILSDTRFVYNFTTGLLSNVQQAESYVSFVTLSSMGYDDQGRVIAVADAEGFNRYFTYDNNGNQVLSYHHWVNPDDPGDIQTIVTRTSYDLESRVVGTAQHALSGQQYLNSAADLAGSTPLHTTSTVYNSLGQVESTTDRFGNISANIFDPNGNLIETRSKVRADVESTFGMTTVPPGEYFLVTRTAYDDNGRTFAVSDPMLFEADGDGLGDRITQSADLRLTHTIYDGMGRVIETRRLAETEITMVTFTPTGSALSLPMTEFIPPTTPVIHTSSITEYGDNGLVKLTRSRVYDATGPSDELVTGFIYDTAQRQIATLQAIDLDQDGMTDATLDPDGVPIVDLDDADDDGRPDHYNDPREVIMTYTIYDASGRQERTIDARGNSTSFIYDGLGRVKETRADLPGASVGFDYVSTKTEYDLLGRRSAAIDAVGNRTQFGYDNSGRLTGVTLPPVFDAISGNTLHPIYEYGFDLYGNQTSITDPKANVTKFTFDHHNRQTFRTLPLGVQTPSNPNDFVEQMVYSDASLSQLGSTPSLSVGLGQLEYSVSFEGIVTAHRFNNTPTGGGRLVAAYYYSSLLDYLDDRDDNDTLDDWEENRTFSYDAFGRNVAISLREMVSGSPTLVRTELISFDANGRAMVIETPEGTVGYDYDRAGRQTRTWTGDSSTPTTEAEYDHDILGRIISTTATVRNGQSTGELPTRYYFDANGNMDLMRLPNDVVTDYVYDQLNRLEVMTQFYDANNDNAFGHANDRMIASYDYDLRADGKRTGVTEEQYDPNGQLANTTRFEWVYDELGRLIGEAYQNTATASDNYLARYRFDLASNRTEKAVEEEPTLSAIDAFLANIDALNPDFTTTYDYDANDRLRCQETLDSAQTLLSSIEYEYGLDDSGTQQTKKTERDSQGDTTNVTASTYNLQGRLSKVEIDDDGIGQPDTTLIYEYNSQGIRVSQSEQVGAGAATTTEYLIDGQNPTGYAQVLEERIGSTLQRSYTLGHDLISQYAATPAPSAVYFFLYDGHGSTRVLTDADGDIVSGQQFSYDAYGNPIGFTNEQSLTNHLYSGEWTDAATGLQYLRARYYDPNSGRWKRLDDFAGNTSDPQSLHKYTYAHNDPLNNVDPSGLFSIGGAIAVGGITGALAGLSFGAAAGAREAGQLLSFKTLEYGFYGLIAGAASGALVGGATFLAAPAVARLLPSGIQFALSGNHPSFVTAFGVGVVAGLGASAAGTSQATAAVSTIASGGLSAGALYFTTRSGYQLMENSLGGAFVEWFRTRVLWTNWSGRPVTPKGIPRAFGAWGLMFTAGFAVGYTAGELTQGLTNVFIGIAENGLNARVAADNRLSEQQAESLLDA